MNPARNLITNTTTKQKVMLGASAVGVLLVMVFMLRLATQPSYTTVLTGLDPSETGKVTSALDQKGIKYELQNNGTALAVDKSKTAEARIALAEGGAAGGGGQKGYELFDSQKLGASDFQQKVTYQRALEGEIGNTIEQIDGVNGARVDLVLPEDELFEDEQSQAKAAVLLDADGASLDPASVRGMAQLVASGVKGLQTSEVTITDQAGVLLWPKEGADGASTATTKQAAEGRYAQELEASLNALLSQTIGPGKGRVEVRADLNVDETTRDELVYADDGTPLQQRTETEELEGGGGGAGAAGTAGNVPGYGAAGGGAGGSNYNRESEETDFGVNKTVTRTKVAPGAVNKLDVGVVVDSSIPPAELTELESALSSAAGVDQRRGDTLTVSQMTFAKPEMPKKPGAAAGALGYVKYVLLGIATLLFLFFVTRALRKREAEGLGDPTWLRELTAPTPLAALEGGMQMPAQPDLEIQPSPLRDQANDLASRDPERVAQQVRAWVNEG